MSEMSLFNDRALELLMYMHRREKPAKMTELIEEMPFSQGAVYNALRTLQKLSLVEEEKTKEFPQSRLLKVSDKGKQAIEKLLELTEILGLSI